MRVVCTSLLYGVLAALAFSSASVRAAADSTSSASPTPQPPPNYVQIEQETSPDYTGETGSSTAVNVSGQTVVGGGRYLLRFKLPIVTSAPAESVTGAGDLAIYDLRILPAAAGNWVAGLTARIPTAGNSSLGSDKYSIGPALGYTQPGKWTWGFFSQNYFSVVGPSWRSGVGKSKIEPILSLALPRGWSVGFSSMSFTYDWVLNKWTEVPIGARVSKRFGNFGRVFEPLAASFEAEENISKVHDAPGWTTRLSLRWIL